MAQPIPTPPSAAAGRSTSVLDTAFPPDDGSLTFLAAGINPTSLFGDHYDAHGGNIISLTLEFISNDSPSIGNPLKR